MKWAALLAWVANARGRVLRPRTRARREGKRRRRGPASREGRPPAGGGFVMGTSGRPNGAQKDQPRRGQGPRPPMIFGHFGLAAAGLVVWIIYVAADTEA